MSCKGVVFALELGLLSLKEKTLIRQKIEAASGTITAIVGNSTRVLIATPAEIARGGFKIVTANNLGIPIFPIEELDSVIQSPPSPRCAKPPSSPKSNTAVESFLSSSTCDLQPIFDFGGLAEPGYNDQNVSSSSSSLTNKDYAASQSQTSEMDEENFIFGFGLDFDAPEPTTSSMPIATSSMPITTKYVPSDMDIYAEEEDNFLGSMMGVLCSPRSSASSEEEKPKIIASTNKSTIVAATNKSKIALPKIPVTTTKIAPLTTEKPKIVTPSKEALAERASKYDSLTSKSFSFTPSPITFTSLKPAFEPKFKFELKAPVFTPITPVQPKPISLRSKQQQQNVDTPHVPIIFDSLKDLSTVDHTSIESNNGSDTSVTESAIGFEIDENDEAGDVWEDEEWDEEWNEEWEEEWEDDEYFEEEWEDDEYFEDRPAPTAAPAPQVKPTKPTKDTEKPKTKTAKSKTGPLERIYRDSVTGIAWKKKKTKVPPSLVLQSNHGNIIVLKSQDSEGDSLPSLVSKPNRPSAAARKTGNVTTKFTWADIASGKATTTKLVPAHDGLKLFVSGFKFDDLTIKGKPASEQLPAFKEAYLKKEKERNEKVMRKLRKKAKRAAKDKAIADAEGKIIETEKAVTKKISDARSINRMRTDEQLLELIDVWTPKQVETAIKQRQIMIEAIFKRFGDISTFDPDWDKGFLFVTYKHTQSAKTALRSLQDFDTRNGVIRRLKESFARAPKETFPSPSFYVRWPKCYQRKLDRKKKQKKEKDEAERDAQAAARAAKSVQAASSS